MKSRAEGKQLNAFCHQQNPSIFNNKDKFYGLILDETIFTNELTDCSFR